MTRFFTRILFLLLLLVPLFGAQQAEAQMTIDHTVTTFPTTISNITSAGGQTALGMQGGCPNLPCCSTQVIKVILPFDAVLRMEMVNFTPLAGSMIAYTSTVANPTDFSDLEYVAAQPGNFCGFRDTLQLGRGVAGWDNTPYGQTPTAIKPLTAIYDFNAPSTQAGYFPAGEYYVLMFNENQQANNLGGGSIVDITFEVVQACAPLTVPASLDFASLEFNSQSDTLDFYVKNDRQLDVTIDVSNGVNITGADSSEFSILTFPSSALAVGDSSLVQVIFAPTSGGAKTASLDIAFSDTVCSADNSVVLNGIGAEPELVVLGNGQSISNNDLTPTTSNNTDFGAIVVNTGSISKSFVITNTGTDTLLLPGSPVVDLQGSSFFSLTSSPVTSIAPGDSSTFTIIYTPTAIGLDTVDVVIANNDSNQSTYTFRIYGTSAGLNGLDFDGSGDYVNIDVVAPAMVGINAFTIETWVKVDPNQSGNDMLVGVNTSSNGSRMFLKMDDGVWEFDVGSTSRTLPGPDIRDDVWHHVAFTFNDGDIVYYLDGALTATNSNSSLSFTSTDKWSIGQEYDNGGASDFFNGAVNEFRLWGTVKTGSELSAGRFCELQNPASDTNLIAYYTFNHGLAEGNNSFVTSITDGSANGFNGTPVGFALSGTSSNFIAATDVGAGCTSVNAFVCDASTYLSPAGNVYDSNGVYIDTIMGSMGGDSVIYTNLIINFSTYTQDVITDTTVCDTIIEPASTTFTSIATFENGNSDWVEINGVVDSLVNTNRSVFLWMREPDQVSSSADILVGINTSGTGTVCNLGIATNEQLWIYDGGSNRNSGVVVTDGNWHFVGYTYDEASNLTQFWVDGVAAASFSNGQSISSTSRISIGQEFDGTSTGNFYDGDMTELSIWNEVLDSADIAAIMSRAITAEHPKYNSLKAYYPMMSDCGEDGFTVKDFGPHGYDGAASNNNIVITDSLVDLAGFNAAPHYNKTWTNGGATLSSDDTLSLTGTLQGGAYNLSLTRDNFEVNDSWNVSIQALCAGPVVAMVVDSNAACNGFSNGGATASATGGTTPYTFSWSNTATNASITGVLAGTYSVTVTDANGMTDSSSVVITEPALLIAATVVDLNASCNTFLDGGATASATGGTMPYTYSWSNSATNASITGVGAGTYSVTITDGNGCFDSTTVTITEPAPLVAATVVDSNASCNTFFDGGATASATGGSMPYTYAWSNSATNASITGVAAGTYSVTITDANGCTDSTSVSITEPAAIMLSSGTINDTIDLTVNGGTMPYNYLWSNGATTEDLNGISSGTYTVTVSDANGCTATQSQAIVSPADFFVTTWKTDNSGVSNSTSINIYTQGGLTYNYDVDWDGDGVFDEFGLTGNATHDYSVAGTYTVQIKGDFPAIYFFSSAGYDNAKLLSVEQWGAIAWEDMHQAFRGCENLVVNATDAPDLSNVTDMSNMFYEASSVNSDFDHWDVSNVTDMSGLFYRADVFNGDITSWAVDSVTNMQAMFREALVFNQDISGWDVGSVTNMVQLFARIDSFNQDIGIWDVSSVNDMSFMFESTESFNQDIGSWSVGNVTDMRNMFSIAETFNQDIGGWDVSKVTDMQSMFNRAEAFNQDIDNWNVGSVTNMRSMFQDADSFNQDLNSWDVGSVTNMLGMFSRAATFNGDITSWQVDSVTTMAFMFNFAQVFNQPLNGWNTSMVTNMQSMFNNAEAFNQDLNSWDVSSVTTMEQMFDRCDVFNGNISAWDVGSVTTMYSMFRSCYLFDQDLSGWDVSDVTNMLAMFNQADDFDQNLGGWDVDSLLFPNSMFLGAELSTANYDSLLIGWASQNVQFGRHFHGGDSKYCEGDSARDVLINTFGWTITDGGQDCPFSLDLVANSNVSCNGLSDGEAMVTVLGGTAPFTYAWSNGAINTTISGLAAGTYTVTVTDANSATTTDAITITQPALLVAASAVDSNAFCNGSLDGGATASATGGTMPYTYAWSNSATTASITGVGAATYSVTITDANGCTDSTSVTITEPTAIEVTNAQIQPDCGISNGTVNITVSGASSPYSFLWSNGAMTEDLAAVSSGSYTVTITDVNGCTKDFNFNVSNVGSLTATSTSDSTNCFGGNDGSIDVTPVGGAAPYIYNWSTGASSEDLNSLSAGFYTVTVTDTIGCLFILTDTVSEPDSITFSANATSVSCVGGADGAIDLTVAGGTAPFTYSWSNGFMSEDPNGLAAGTYTVTATDANGCTSVDSFNTTELPAITASVTIDSYTSLEGATDGIATASASGGTMPYSYLWSNGDTTATISMQPSGVYTVIITDANGCADEGYGYIGVTPTGCQAVLDWEQLGADEALMLPSYDTKGINVDLTFTESGGAGHDDNFSFEHGTRGGISSIGHIQFDMDASSNNDPNQFNQLEIDFSDPVRNLSFTITDIDAASSYADSMMVAAYDNQGNVVTGYFAVVGDSIHFDYSTDTLRAVGLGNSGNSEDFGSAEIIFPDTVSKLVVWQLTSTSGNADPDDHRIYLSALTFENDYQGVYDDYVSVQENDTLYALVTSNDDLTCHDPQTLSLVTAPLNGASQVFGTDSIGYAPAAKFYGIDSLQYAVCDSNGLCDSAWMFVSVLPQFVDSLSWTANNADESPVIDSMFVYRNRVDFNFKDSANIDDGDNFTVESSSQVGQFDPVSYMQFDINANSTTAADEFVEVSMDFESAVRGLYFHLIDVDNSSSGGGVDSINVAAYDENGQPVQVYFFDMGSATTAFREGASRSFYGINESSSSSQGFANVGVFVPDSVQKVVVNYDPPYTSDGDGNPASQTSYISDIYWRQALPEIALYNESTLIANQDSTPSTADSTDFGTVFLGDSLAVTYAIVNEGNDTLMIDNPISISGSNSMDFTLISTVADTLLPGDTTELVVEFAATTAGMKGAIINIANSDPCDTLYQFGVQGEVECPTLTAATVVDSNVSCNSFLDGGATASITGGTAPYTYAWSNSATTASITGVGAGTYSMTITDAFGCFDSTSVTITEPALLVTATVVDSNVSCNTFADGGATASATGGTMPYTYAWSNSATTASITGVVAGTYSVTITDFNGCTDSSSVTITEPALLVAASVVDSNVSCNSFLDGGATVSGTGGTMPYTYAWSNAATNASITGVGAATYSVTITDANGCTDSASVTITEPAILSAGSVADSNATCNGFFNGGATASATGGTMPYTYAWSNTATNASITGVGAATYSVTITDANGCTDSTSVTISEPALLVAATVVDSNVTCNGFSNGGGTASATGGTMPYTYAWSNAATTASITGVAGGTYSLTITDANGCTDSTSMLIAEPDVLLLTIVVDSNESCTGLANGGMTANATGGTMPYTYAWSNAATNASITGLATATYSVTLTDANGCSATVVDSIILEDVTAPTVFIQNVTVYLDANGQASITATQIDSGSVDACGLSSLVLDSTDFDCNEVGANTVTLTVTDINGNSANAMATVTVMDILVPTVQTQNVTLYLDASGQATTTATAIDSGSFDNCGVASLTLDSTSFDCSEVGANTVTLVATDDNGNTSSATATITVMDTILPTVQAQNVTVYLDANGQASVTASTIDNGSFDNCGVASLSLDESSFDCNEVGTNTVKLFATDNNGNTDSTTATVTVLDTILPTVQAQNVTVYLDANGQASTTAAAIDNGSFDNCGVATLTLDSTDFDCSEVGANTVTLFVTDNNGNTDSTTATVTVLDTILPTVQTQNVTVWLDANGQASTTATAIDNGSFDNCGVASLMLDSTNFDCSEVGANTVTLFVTDNNGNVDSATATVTVLDTILPTVQAQNITLWLDVNGQSTTTAAAIDNGSFDNCGVAALVLDSTDFDCSEVGTNSVTLFVTDNNGNVDSTTATVTVLDTILPTVQAQNVTVWLDANGQASTTAAAIDNGSFDNCGVATLTLDSTDFDCSEVGANTVTLFVTDNNGNVDSTTATVTVLDTILPTVITQNVTVWLDANGQATTTAAAINNGSFDNCGVASLTLDSTNFDCAEVGANTVTLFATDNNGNVDSTTATVTVLDTLDPTVITQNLTLYLDANGEASTTAIAVDNGSFDNCQIATLALDSTNFDCGETGANTVTLTVTDVNGNVSSGTATITVLDTIAPQLIVANDTAVCATDAAGTVVTYTNSSSDNCTTGGIVLVNGLPSGSTFPIGTTTNVFEVIDASGNVTTDSFTIEVFNFPVLSIDAIGSICETADPVTLTAVPVGGVFSGNGVTGNTFDPMVVNTGNEEITYTFTTAENCVYSTTAFAEVRENPVVLLGSFPDSICIELEVVALPVATPSGGMYSGPGVDSILLYTDTAGVGQHWITYTFEDAFGCSSSDSTLANIVRCLDPLSVNEQAKGGFNWEVFPNPNNGTFRVQHTHNGPVSGRIYAADGSVVQQIPVLTKDHEIILETWSQGIYILHITGENLSETKHIVVQ